MKKYLTILGVSLSVVVVFSIFYSTISLVRTNIEQPTYIETASVSQNKEIQQRLKDLGYYNGAIDGVLGSGSVAAIKAFQRDNGLKADGIVGAKTAAKLNISITSQNSNDIYLLAKCVHAEARGEVYVGQVAVAAVILNRVKSPDFPNTIAGVVYQPWAFTAVHDGQINLEPNQSAYNAARDAMNGWDPTYGCLYYYNPEVATSKWIFSRQTVVTIGKHIFAI